MAEIVSIVYKPANTPVPKGRYLRVPLQQAQLVAGYGIEGDRKGGHPDRHLNIMSAETLEQLAAEGFQVEPGLMGEQIIVAGLDVNQLEAGERLQMGNEAVVEVTKLRTGCDRFEAYQGRHPSLAVDRLGVIAKVVAGGSIRPGDRVAVIANV